MFIFNVLFRYLSLLKVTLLDGFPVFILMCGILFWMIAREAAFYFFEH
ncbi:hypothetical protein N898_02620 [Salmonella enterica subsp. arizonae serovar 62:z36:- str. RKS2983]|nr:hypothetical protein N898_02620 [Salmonella enterica subsp. arizonae serovar 62:z36:- str. RKS2983]